MVDYSVYVDMDKQVIIYKRPSLQANIAGFVKPFNANVIGNSPVSVPSYFLYPHLRSKAGCCAYVRNH
ncbi:hypothetical protein E2C01_068381 [Portunus trituberculatus]|uniref:Uncharacterized protein n=1 Tax=Portunus trituberculatus TaxID=210409 RepID=A0A5B7HWC1_PORTR|nr:hypothetical protein [Portunus trituberculatus]